MTNNLTNAGDGFGVPENSGNQFIVGKMMKFADGEYIVDKTEPLPADIELVALAVTTVSIGMHLTVAGDTMLDRLAIDPVHPGGNHREGHQLYVGRQRLGLVDDVFAIGELYHFADDELVSCVLRNTKTIAGSSEIVTYVGLGVAPLPA